MVTTALSRKVSNLNLRLQECVQKSSLRSVLLLWSQT
jgi:hypothetical protein